MALPDLNGNGVQADVVEQLVTDYLPQAAVTQIELP